MKKVIKCTNCNKKFNLEKYNFICPNCNTYNNINKINTIDIDNYKPDDNDNHKSNVKKNIKKSILIFLYNTLFFAIKILIAFNLIFVIGDKILDSSYKTFENTYNLNQTIKMTDSEYVFKSIKKLDQNNFKYNLSKDKILINIECKIKNTDFYSDKVNLKKIDINTNNYKQAQFIGVLNPVNNILDTLSSCYDQFLPLGRTSTFNLVYSIPLNTKSIDIHLNEYIENSLFSNKITYLFESKKNIP